MTWKPTEEMWNAAYDAAFPQDDSERSLLDALIAVQPLIRAEVLNEAATATLEQRCERDTPWDVACTTIAKVIRAL